MVNEQKARDIAIEIEKKSFLNGFGQLGIVIEEIENAAIKMAEWKDEENIEHSDIDFIKVCNFLLTKGIDLDMFDWRKMSFKYKEYIKQQAMREE